MTVNYEKNQMWQFQRHFSDKTNKPPVWGSRGPGVWKRVPNYSSTSESSLRLVSTHSAVQEHHQTFPGISNINKLCFKCTESWPIREFKRAAGNIGACLRAKPRETRKHCAISSLVMRLQKNLFVDGKPGRSKKRKSRKKTEKMVNVQAEMAWHKK